MKQIGRIFKIDFRENLDEYEENIDIFFRDLNEFGFKGNSPIDGAYVILDGENQNKFVGTVEDDMLFSYSDRLSQIAETYGVTQ
jgi:hypothetical protein